MKIAKSQPWRLRLRALLMILKSKAIRCLSARTPDGLLRPTWHNVQQTRADIDQLREEMDPYDA